MPEPPRWDGPPIESWTPWTPGEVAALLAGVGATWAVAGGWALDLWLGRQTREHEDLEIAVPALGFPEVQTRLEARGLRLFSNVNGEVIELAPGEARGPEGFQTWATDAEGEAWRLDIFREPGDAQTWVYRRTGELSAPRAWASGHSADGIPYVAPQIVLLFKAKATRDKDQADFDLVAPRLSPKARAWLADALRTLQPGHAWIQRLEGMGGD